MPRNQKEKKNKLSFKEKKELENIQELLPKLEEEKKSLEMEMSSGSIDHQALMEKGNRINELISEIDELEFRALELMEKDN